MVQNITFTVFDPRTLTLSTAYRPAYYSSSASVINGIPDRLLVLAIPVVAYWSLSMLFHGLDLSQWKWLEKYRIHPSAAVASRNLATRSQVVWAVALQQVIQTAVGYLWISEEVTRGMHLAEDMNNIARRIQPVVWRLYGADAGLAVLEDLVPFLYWWGIPVLQLLGAMFWIDTWQYFLHRLMHVNKFLFKHIHSWHHRLYVPYAFGSLYNHPVEGFLLDTLGAAMAEWMTGLSVRQAMVLFALSTCKTVDDHCGYSLPFDPLQLLTSNNADYHDIHHQVIGIKSNFAQPFFVHWDALLGTRLTRRDIELKRGKAAKSS